MTNISAVQRAGRFVDEGRPSEAIALVEEAGNAGDVEALMQLAVWRLGGVIVPRNLPAARALLRRAVEIGHVDAALMEIALVANGSGAPADWPLALELLRRAASGDHVAAAQLRLIEAMRLDANGNPRSPPKGRQIGSDPRVTLFPGFLTPAECEHLASVAAGRMEPALIADPDTGELRRHPIRTSDYALIGPAIEDLATGAINRRIAAVSGTEIGQGEALNVLRYAPGQQYRLHHDALPGEVNQRFRTMVIYLNQGFSGGETHFPANGLTVTPKGGDAIMFDNCRADGSVDPLSRHAGLPVRQGVKWVATRWIRQAPFDPWTAGQQAAGVDASK